MSSPRERIVTKVTTVLEMWSEHDQIWVPQDSTSAETIIDLENYDED